MKRFSVLSLLILSSVAAHADMDRDTDLQQRLDEFKKNPAEAMKRKPRVVSNGVPSKSPFTAEEIADNKFVEIKDKARAKNTCWRTEADENGNSARVCLDSVLPGRAPFHELDMAENLADKGTKIIRKLETMETKDLKSAALEETPWSDDYWAIFRGQVAARYADKNYPDSRDTKMWKDYAEYSRKNDFLEIFNSGDAEAIDTLSPAEKYDLLVGDKKGNLTQYNWAEGASYAENNRGKVETWMGICHGWAPAAYMIPRPEKAIKAMAADGQTELTFYPSDIKALSSLLWAKTEVYSRFIGGRCGDKKPKKDSNGRVLSEECFDTNPGTWHMAIVNQIGVSKRGFVMDVTYNYEVWNQPVYSYKYSYFNPKTGKRHRLLDKARVDIADLSDDPFASYRSSEAVSVVGIEMDVTYVVETDPTHAKTDAPDQDATKTETYQYDLELDARGNIIGGEWYSEAHPDFLWTPEQDDRTVTDGDRLATGRWSLDEAMPTHWRRAAASTSRKIGSPLAKVIELLVKKSHGSRE